MAVKPITETQYKESLKSPKDQRKVVKTQDNQQTTSSLVNKIDQDMFIQTSSEGQSDYFRHTLPSRGLFYKVRKDLLFRPLKVKDLKKIQHFLNTDNITYLIDAVQNCIESDVDVRDLTKDDFFFTVFQICFSSHQKPEYKFEWTSFYGNLNKEVVTQNDLEINEVDYKSLLQEVPNWSDLRFFPISVRSYETYYNNRFKPDNQDQTWDEEKTSLYEDVAIYFNEETPDLQIERAENLDVRSDEFKALKIFKKLSKHDIKTEIVRSDRFFDRDKAIIDLKERLESLNKLAFEDYEKLVSFMPSMDMDSVEEEINRLELAQSQSQEVRAKEETIPFRLNLASFIEPILL